MLNKQHSVINITMAAKGWTGRTVLLVVFAATPVTGWKRIDWSRRGGSRCRFNFEADTGGVRPCRGEGGRARSGISTL
ncbi:MAG TPA: hypothetical protein VFY06_06840 [Verrucomicrobiae bacterium]|nr:hypothetical protein [Verrucomicrobiae bacterium]